MSRVLSVLAAVMLLILPQLARAYTIAPGDTLHVEVLEDPGLNRQLLVLPDGSVNFPGAGAVRVSGLSPASAGQRIGAGIAAQFASPPSVHVSVVGLAAPAARREPAKIFVMGEVNRPGMIQSGADLSLLQAIAQSGGFTRFAATRRVELHRIDPKTRTERVYIYDQKTGQGISGAVALAEGDVIVVPERGLFER